MPYEDCRLRGAVCPEVAGPAVVMRNSPIDVVCAPAWDRPAPGLRDEAGMVTDAA